MVTWLVFYQKLPRTFGPNSLPGPMLDFKSYVDG